MSSSSLWQRFQQYFLYYRDLGFSLDISRMKFPDDFFEKMRPKIDKASAAMRALEAGEIANPTENRMVGHYWLRNTALAPTPEIRTEIEQTHLPLRGRFLPLLTGGDRRFERTDVDAQFEGACGDECRQSAGLELLLDLEPLLAGDAAVMRPDEVLAGQLVQPLRQSLAQASTIGEDDRALVGTDQLQDARVDRRPDAAPGVGADRRPARLLLLREDLAERGHVVDRDDHLELEGLAGAGIDDRDLTVRAEAAEETCDRVERSLGGAEADALGRLVEQVVEVDEDLMTQYLEKGEVTPKELHEPLERALREGHLIPVVFTSARTGAGIAELLEVIVKLLVLVAPCASVTV